MMSGVASTKLRNPNAKENPRARGAIRSAHHTSSPRTRARRALARVVVAAPVASTSLSAATTPTRGTRGRARR
jgi:hypothetical protein